MPRVKTTKQFYLPIDEHAQRVLPAGWEGELTDDEWQLVKADEAGVLAGASAKAAAKVAAGGAEAGKADAEAGKADAEPAEKQVVEKSAAKKAG